MGNELTLAPFAAQGDWHLVLARYVLCAAWAKGRRVLDLSCGRGVGCEVLSRLGASHVTGVDSREELTNWARSSFRSDDLVFRAVGAGDPLPFPNNSFDLVVALDSQLAFTPEKLLEVRRVLSDGGVVVITDWSVTPATLEALLPRHSRVAPVPPRGVIQPAAISRFFGQPIVVSQQPLLGFVFDIQSGGGPRVDWSAPQAVLADEDDLEETAFSRLLVFGLDESELRQERARLVALPYEEIFAELQQLFDDMRTDADRALINSNLLERDLADKEQLIGDLNLEVYTLRQSLQALNQELAQWRAGESEHDETPFYSSVQPGPSDRELRDHIDRLWQSAVEWQQYAEQLEAEVDLLSADRTQIQGELDLEREARLAQEEVAEASHREEELAHEIQGLKTALDDAETRVGKTEVDLARKLDALARAREENRRRDKLQKKLEKQIEHNRKRFDEFAREATETTESRDQYKRELAAAEKQLSEVHSKSNKAEETSVSLENEIRNKATKIQSLEREIVGLKVELSSRERENTRLMQKMATLDRKVVTLTSNLAAAKPAEVEKVSDKAPPPADKPADKRKPRAKRPPKPIEPDKPKAEKPARPKPVEPDKPKAEKPARPKPVEPDKPKAEKPARPKPVEPDKPKAEKPARPKPVEPDKPKAEKLVRPKPVEPAKPKAKKPAKTRAEKVAKAKPKKVSRAPAKKKAASTQLEIDQTMSPSETTDVDTPVESKKDDQKRAAEVKPPPPRKRVSKQKAEHAEKDADKKPMPIKKRVSKKKADKADEKSEKEDAKPKRAKKRVSKKDDQKSKKDKDEKSKKKDAKPKRAKKRVSKKDDQKSKKEDAKPKRAKKRVPKKKADKADEKPKKDKDEKPKAKRKRTSVKATEKADTTDKEVAEKKPTRAKKRAPKKKAKASEDDKPKRSRSRKKSDSDKT